MGAPFDKHATQSALLAALSKQQQDDRFTDLIVKSGGKEHKVHKAVLCATSEWFETACTGRFKEANSKTIELHGDDEDATAAMIHYCYQFDYIVPAAMPMTFHVRMFTVADKYFIPALRSLALEKLQKSAAAQWNIADFTVAVREIYEETSDPKCMLKSMVVQASVKHSAELFGHDGDVAFGEMANDLPNYAMDVLCDLSNSKKRKREADEGPWRYRCSMTLFCIGHFVVADRAKAGRNNYLCTSSPRINYVDWGNPNDVARMKRHLIEG